jgi:hypothetical protein
MILAAVSILPPLMLLIVKLWILLFVNWLRYSAAIVWIQPLFPWFNRSFIWDDLFFSQPYRKVGKVENGERPRLKRKFQQNLFAIQDLTQLHVNLYGSERHGPFLIWKP